MFPHFPPYPHPDMLHPYHSPANSPDIPSDFRAFYPYTPNEVKHRKRTTSTQLRTLENVFKRETKPNAALRNQLAEELKMTPRGVQVWFQNRRAKEKTKANKAKVAAEVSKQHDASPSSHGPSRQTSSPAPSTNSSHTESQTPVDQGEQPDIAISADPSIAQRQLNKNTPPVITPPQLHVFTESMSSSWDQQSKMAIDDTLTATNQRPSEMTNAQLYALRRGSLPVHSPHQSTGSALLCPPAVLHRRASVDTTNMLRAGLNPYGRSNPMRAQRTLAGRSPPLARALQSYPPGRPGLHPHQHSMDMRRGSIDSRTMFLSQRGTMSSSQPPLSICRGPRSSLPISNHLYAAPSRTISPPGPGPLPTPNFQFGAASSATAMASSSSGESDRNSPDSPNSFTYREGDCDDDNTSVGSYVPHSRFGSFQSIATSESGSLYTDYTNPTSALPSPAIMSGRRHSCTPAFVGLMSALGVHDASPSSIQESVIGSSYTPDEAQVASNEYLENGPSVGPVLGPSPPNGDAACTQDTASAANFAVSRQSELSYALDNQQQQIEPSKLERHTYNHGHAPQPPFLNPFQHDGSYYISENEVPLGDAMAAGIPDYESTSLTTSESVFNVHYPHGYLSNNNAGEELQAPMDYTRCPQLTDGYPNCGDFTPTSVFPLNDNSQTADRSVAYA